MSSFPPPPKDPSPYGQPAGQPYGAPYGQGGGEPPLWLPYYGAPFAVAVRRFFKKYATFSGRASRSEYWWWALVAFVIGTILGNLGNIHGGAGAAFSVIDGLWGLATIVPSLALTWRRLHDTGRAGGWAFIGLIPIVGWIIVIVWLASASKPEGQRFDTPGVQYDPPAPQY